MQYSFFSYSLIGEITLQKQIIVFLEYGVTFRSPCSVKLHPGHVVADLDKILYDNYLCLVALYKQKILWTKSRRTHRSIMEIFSTVV